MRPMDLSVTYPTIVVTEEHRLYKIVVPVDDCAKFMNLLVGIGMYDRIYSSVRIYNIPTTMYLSLREDEAIMLKLASHLEIDNL